MEVYRAYSNEVAYTGSAIECLDWVMKQAFTLKGGRKIYRHWKENGKFFYDVEVVYYTDCDLHTAAEVEAALHDVEFDPYDNDESDGHLYNKN